MKNIAKQLTVMLAALSLGLAACGTKDEHAGHDHKGHDHEGHDHEGEDHAGHDHAAHAEHAKGEHPEDHDGHDHGEHAAKTGGPHGGRLIHSIEPHAELLVLDDRRIKINFLDDDLKAVAAGSQVVSLTGGDRTAPFRLAFAKDGDALLSDKPVPAGDDHPVVLQIKANADAKAAIEKFHLNLSDCPTCKYKEYACTCDHGDHKHGEDGKGEGK